MFPSWAARKDEAGSPMSSTMRLAAGSGGVGRSRGGVRGATGGTRMRRRGGRIGRRSTVDAVAIASQAAARVILDFCFFCSYRRRDRRDKLGPASSVPVSAFFAPAAACKLCLSL